MQRPALSPDSVYTVAHARIIHESVANDDVLIIDLDRGVYFNLQGAACGIWQTIVHGMPLAAIPAEIERRYSNCAPQLSAVVAEFVASLLEEGLLAPSAAAAISGGPTSPERSEPTRYRPPSLARYTDLEDLLRADPIHEILDPEV